MISAGKRWQTSHPTEQGHSLASPHPSSSPITQNAGHSPHQTICHAVCQNLMCQPGCFPPRKAEPMGCKSGLPSALGAISMVHKVCRDYMLWEPKSIWGGEKATRWGGHREKDRPWGEGGWKLESKKSRSHIYPASSRPQSLAKESGTCPQGITLADPGFGRTEDTHPLCYTPSPLPRTSHHSKLRTPITMETNSSSLQPKLLLTSLYRLDLNALWSSSWWTPSKLALF